MNFFKTPLALLLSLCLFTSCFEDIDDKTVSTIEINDFVWKALNIWYYWQQDVPDLADNRFSTDEEYRDFLNSFASPRELFDHLKFSEDRFSWIVDDYIELLNSLDGISKSNGMEFGLAQISGSNNLIGFVQYVLPNTDASAKGIQRGDLFTAVNGMTLTVNNYADLLFGDADSYTINMATYNGTSVERNGQDVVLTKKAYTENPIFITKTFEYAGKKVGYLLYNQFINDFDKQLNSAFADFKANGIEELVVDFRYNPGGNVSSAIHLSTMITGQFTGELYLTQVYNDKINALIAQEDLSIYFPNTLTDGTVISKLNLDKVYILTQRSSASASELVINALNPYIDVIQIGDVTRGKNEFSNTLLDIPSCAYILSSDCDASPNPNHTWGIQPLLGRNANADGFYQYTDGLMPLEPFILPENIFDLGVLGDLNEPLLARALQHISGNGKAIYTKQPGLNFRAITDSKMHTLKKDNMYLDDVPEEIIRAITSFL